MNVAKHKVSELEGALLDAAVAKCFGKPASPAFVAAMQALYGNKSPLEPAHFQPSIRWQDGGPLIEREQIAVYFDDAWIAGFELGIDHWEYGGDTGSGSSLELKHGATGATPLIAAMRAYVASKFGDEVDLP